MRRGVTATHPEIAINMLNLTCDHNYCQFIELCITIDKNIDLPQNTCTITAPLL